MSSRGGPVEKGMESAGMDGRRDAQRKQTCTHHIPQSKRRILEQDRSAASGSMLARRFSGQRWTRMPTAGALGAAEGPAKGDAQQPGTCNQHTGCVLGAGRPESRGGGAHRYLRRRLSRQISPPVGICKMRDGVSRPAGCHYLGAAAMRLRFRRCRRVGRGDLENHGQGRTWQSIPAGHGPTATAHQTFPILAQRC